jgi:hypothetical protein
MLLYQLLSAQRLPAGRFKVSFACEGMPAMPADVWELEVDAKDLLDFARWRQCCLKSLGIVFSPFPDQRFHRSTNSPLGLRTTAREWDAHVQRALSHGPQFSNSAA